MQDSDKNQLNVSLVTPPADTPSVDNARQISRFLERLFRWVTEDWQIVCLVLVFLCMHLYILSFVDDLIYDEHFWVPEAQRVLHGGPLIWPTYPALSKVFIASGIAVFGDNSWGWRIPSVVFGAVSVLLVYFIARKLAGKPTALLASLLLVFDNVTFTMTGLAMLDVFALPFMLLSFLLYLNNRHALSGLSLAVAVVCSPKAVLGVVLILAHWLLVRRRQGIAKVGVFAIVALLCFLILMPITDFMATGEWFNPFSRISEMWSSQTSVRVGEMTPYDLEVTHPVRPWWWIIDPRGAGLEPSEFRHYIIITPTVWILIIPSIAYLLYRYFSVKKRRTTARFVLLWIASTYLIWIPIALATDRPMFLYYLLPTMGAISIAVAYAIRRVWEKSKAATDRTFGWLLRAFIVLYLVVHIAVFVIISPLPAAIAGR